MDGKKFDKNTLKTLVIAASLLLNCVLGGASYTYYHHLAEQMNETASLQSQVSHLEGSISDLQAPAVRPPAVPRVTVRPSRQLTAARTTKARPFTSRTPAPNITAPAAGI